VWPAQPNAKIRVIPQAASALDNVAFAGAEPGFDEQCKTINDGPEQKDSE